MIAPTTTNPNAPSFQTMIVGSATPTTKKRGSLMSGASLARMRSAKLVMEREMSWSKEKKWSVEFVGDSGGLRHEKMD